jgi:hypothetical protein
MEQHRKKVKKIDFNFFAPISKTFRSCLLRGRKVNRTLLLKEGKKLGVYSGGHNVQLEKIADIFFVEYEGEVFLVDKLPQYVCTIEQFNNKKPFLFKELDK